MIKTTMRSARSPLRLLSTASLFALALLLPDGAAFGASLSVSSAQVQESGGTARVCVGLSSGGENVAATQNELSWDANCASLIDNCDANSAHGKQLMANQTAPSVLKTIILSLQDTNKIPDGELYCCNFRAELSSGCCAIGVQNVGASDPEGKALGLAGRGGQICLASKPGSGGGLDAGRRQQPDVVGADLGDTRQQAPPAGQPAGQEPPPKAAGGGNAVASGGTGGVQGGVGGVPGGIGGVPGGQPGAPGQPGQAQPGQVAQQPAADHGSAPAPGSDAARPQDPVAGAPQSGVAAERTPPRVPAAAVAPPTSAPAVPAAAPRAAAPAAKAAATVRASSTAKAAAAPAPAPQGSGCSCEISPTGVGFEASGALLGLGLLLWARRRRL